MKRSTNYTPQVSIIFDNMLEVNYSVTINCKSKFKPFKVYTSRILFSLIKPFKVTVNAVSNSTI